jgi:hypothetical protein
VIPRGVAGRSYRPGQRQAGRLTVCRQASAKVAPSGIRSVRSRGSSASAWPQTFIGGSFGPDAALVRIAPHGGAG